MRVLRESNAHFHFVHLLEQLSHSSHANDVKPSQVMLPLLLREEKVGARPGGLRALLLALCFPQSWDLLRASEGKQ